MTKKIESLVVLFLVTAALLIITTSVFGAHTFTGAWDSIDVDNSYQIMSIGGGGNNQFHIQYKDFGASVCGKDANGQPIYAAIGSGTGSMQGDVLVAQLNIWCMTQPKTFYSQIEMRIQYDAATNTLFDGYVTWTKKSAK